MPKLIVGLTGLILGLMISILIYQPKQKLPCSSEVNPHCQVYVPQE